jgi:hypothetical protein
MKTPMVEKTAGLVAEYGTGDIEEMWKVRDAHARSGTWAMPGTLPMPACISLRKSRNTTPGWNWSLTVEFR